MSALAVSITATQVRVIDKAIAPVVRRWNLSHSMNIRDLARDCYFQGLLDGASPEVGRGLRELRRGEK